MRTASLRQRGLTLIEVLIAVLVLAIGLVGLAAMHVNSMKYAHSSYYASIASSIALDLEERLWIRTANSIGSCLTDADVSDILTEMKGNWTSNGAGTVSIPGLTIASGTVTEESADPADPDSDNRWVQVPVTVSWTDERVSDNGAESFSYTARVVCFTGDIGNDEDEDELS